MISRTKSPRATFEERCALLAEWERSGLTQREFSEQHGIPVRTFEYYRRQQLRRSAPSAGPTTQLIPVHIAPAAPAQTTPATNSGGGFVLTLSNGRRIEAGWGFCEASLARLLRVAEQA